MNDRVNEPMDQPRIDQRANLLYFPKRCLVLQNLEITIPVGRLKFRTS